MPEDSARGERLRSIALGHYEKWAASLLRSGAVCCARGGTDGVRRGIDRRLETLVQESEPGVAARRWLVESIGAWAPLAVVFSPQPLIVRMPGVSGVLSVHAQEILEKEYAHILATSRSAGTAIELLAAEVQQFDLQIEVAEAISWFLCNPDSGDTLEWIVPFKEMSLAMAEFMHRQVLGISQVLPDSLAMNYSAQISRAQREHSGPVGPAPISAPASASASGPAGSSGSRSKGPAPLHAGALQPHAGA